jgi:hypothetical protein
MDEPTVQVTLPVHARDYLVKLLDTIDREPEASYILDPANDGPDLDRYRNTVRDILAEARPLDAQRLG